MMMGIPRTILHQVPGRDGDRRGLPLRPPAGRNVQFCLEPKVSQCRNLRKACSSLTGMITQHAAEVFEAPQLLQRLKQDDLSPRV
ncbi:hypothetical protein LEMLEM_LOCUS10463 [Lemmus lemmus]